MKTNFTNLNEAEVSPPDFLWDNIENRLNREIEVIEQQKKVIVKLGDTRYASLINLPKGVMRFQPFTKNIWHNNPADYLHNNRLNSTAAYPYSKNMVAFMQWLFKSKALINHIVRHYSQSKRKK